MFVLNTLLLLLLWCCHSTQSFSIFRTQSNVRSFRLYDAKDKELQRYQSRSILLEEALKTLKTQLESYEKNGSAMEAEDAERQVSELQRQISSELKRTERMRISWQNELVKISEKLRFAEEEAERWKGAAEDQRVKSDKYVYRIKALENALAESEQRELQLVEQGSSREAADPSSSLLLEQLERELKEANARLEARERQLLSEVRSLQQDLDASRNQERINRTQQQAMLDAARKDATGMQDELRRVLAELQASKQSQTQNQNQATDYVLADLKEQRQILDRQTKLIQALVGELALLSTKDGAVATRGGFNRPSLPEGDSSRIFSVSPEPSSRPTPTTFRTSVIREGNDDEDSRLVHTQPIEVDGEPYLIDEDNNLYTTLDYRFVKKLTSSTRPSVGYRPGHTGASSDRASAPPVDDSVERARRQRRKERLASFRRTVGDVVGEATSRLALASQSVFRFLVGDDDDDDDDDDERYGPMEQSPRPAIDRGGNVVDVTAIEFNGQRVFDGTKMRPTYLDRQRQGLEERST